MLIYLLTLIDNEGDRQTFTAIYQEYHVQMEKVALRILSEHNDAEDAVQNAWIQVIKHFHKVSEIPCEELLFWLISITKNEALMILRKRRKTVPLENWDATTEVWNHDMNYQEIVALFTRLPETYRVTLEMKFLLQYTDHSIRSASIRTLRINLSKFSSVIDVVPPLLRELAIKEGLHL